MFTKIRGKNNTAPVGRGVCRRLPVNFSLFAEGAKSQKHEGFCKT